MNQIPIFGDLPITSSDKELAPDFHAIVGRLGASSHSIREREQGDFYATDPIAVEWLMKLENLNSNIWEPACGQGHLAKPLIREGYNVKATDLFDRGFGQGGVDFLADEEKWHGDIITNPPIILLRSLFIMLYR